MSVRHLKSLLFRAAEIQTEIDRERSARLPNWIRLLRLKKLRLVLEDRLYRLAAAAARPPQLRPSRQQA